MDSSIINQRSAQQRPQVPAGSSSGYNTAAESNLRGRRTTMSRHNFAACLIVGCTVFIPFAARAQQFAAADALYTTGVEAYFRGRPADAESSFSRLMSVDRNDPRAYYFRALSLIAQGRDNEARSDMETGAQIE